MFGIPAALIGDLPKLWSMSVLGLTTLGAAGIIHFVIGRTMTYESIRLVGANRASPIISTSILVTVILGIILLHEPAGVNVMVAATLVVIGLILLSSAEQPGENVSTAAPSRGLGLALLSALFFGISPLLVRVGVLEAGSAVIGALVSYVFALVVYVAPLVWQRRRVSQFTKEKSLSLFLAAILVNLGQLARYGALAIMPVTIASQIISTYPLFALGVGYGINRRFEAFGLRIIVGVVVVVAGIFALFL